MVASPGFLVEKHCFGNHYLNLCFLLLVPTLLLWYLPPIQTDTKWATSMIANPLADCSGDTVEGVGYDIAKAGQERWHVRRRPSIGCDHMLTQERDP